MVAFLCGLHARGCRQFCSLCSRPEVRPKRCRARNPLLTSTAARRAPDRQRQGKPQAPDRATFRCLDLAYAALAAGGTAPAILNAANEVAVAAFLDQALAFLAIAELIEETLSAIPATPISDLESLVYADLTARQQAQRIMQRSYC